jgi:tyrosyl-tRNA synthetase
MRIPDELMLEWFTLLTDLEAAEISSILAGKPNEAKKRLGAEIVRFYHGESAMTAVLEDWKKQFETGGDPEQIDEVTVPFGEMPVLDLLVAIGFCKSKSEARKKVEEGAMNYGPERVKPTDWKATVAVVPGLVIRLGRKIIRIAS